MDNKGYEMENYLEYLIRQQENILKGNGTNSYSGKVSNDVANSCNAIIQKFITGGKLGDVQFTPFTLNDYTNSKKIGGKFKTDFIIKNGSNTYNVSLKYGEKYHLASPGVAKSTEIFYNAINDAFTSARDVNRAYRSASAIVPYVLQIDKQLSELRTTTKQTISTALNRYVRSPKSSGANIIHIFNNKVSAMSDFYYEMKLNIIEETLTGVETTPSHHADYILNAIDSNNIIFKKIDKNYVSSIVDKISLRITPKSRKGNRQEIAFRFE